MGPLFLLLLVLFTGSQAQTKENRIIKGTPAEKNQFPFAVGILRFETKHCSGSIIHPSWVLTAAHCIQPDQIIPQIFVVVAGVVDLSSDVGRYNVTNLFPYPKWVHNLYVGTNDIGLMKIEGKFREAPVAFGGLPRNPIVTVVGYGQSELSVLDPALKYAHIRLTGVKLFKHVVLAKPIDGFACDGDSGGPVISDEGRQFAVLTGGNCTSSSPMSMAEVASFKPWIEKTIRNNM